MTIKKLTTPAPEGYSQWLWDSIPANRAKAFPGKHETYVFGQQRADGTACIGCSWQSDDVLPSTDEAIRAHDSDRGFKHDHAAWVPVLRDGEHTCPCGQQDLAFPISLDAEAVRAELAEAAVAHDLLPQAAARLIALSDNVIHHELQAAVTQAFYEQFDDVRRKAIKALAQAHLHPADTDQETRT